jgi:predicted 3-demethylubiquinone-9 3-methyltransferase (glyoxalase superfamily)
MANKIQRFTNCLWFDDNAEEAVRFYTSVFDNSKIVTTTHYSREAATVSGRPEGSVMVIAFQLDGQDFSALNGGPIFKFNEAMSIVVNCETQEEIDRYWKRLGEGGDEKAQQCGWLKDRFGVSWQVVPRLVHELMADPAKAPGAMKAILKMKKIDLEALRKSAA